MSEEMETAILTKSLKEASAIILAGGKSSRMGRDKSTVVLEGEPLLMRAIHVLQPIFGEIIVVTNQEIPFETPGAKVVTDEIPHQGPLGGISAGLKVSSHETNFVMAVDMPFVSGPVIEYLASFTGEADIVVPLAAHGLEPLFAFYNKRCLSVIDKVLAREERKILSAYALTKVKVVGYLELSDLEGADKAFINVNTERDLEEAEAKAKGARASDVAAGEIGDIRMPTERATTIYVNSEELVTVQSSLRHIDEMACGFLVAEGILQDRDELESVRADEERGEVRVRLKNDRSIARDSLGKRFVTSGCGKGFSFVSLGHAMGMARVTSDFSVPAATVPKLMKDFLRQSGRPGMHSSAIVRGSEISIVREDIGRHNTVDMILGRLWLDRDYDRNMMLFTTGRISYEMMVKAGKARIPIVVSRTAATDLAVRLAKKLNVELIGYTRAGLMHVYTDGSRLS